MLILMRRFPPVSPLSSTQAPLPSLLTTRYRDTEPRLPLLLIKKRPSLSLFQRETFSFTHSPKPSFPSISPREPRFPLNSNPFPHLDTETPFFHFNIKPRPFASSSGRYSPFPSLQQWIWPLSPRLPSLSPRRAVPRW